MSKSIGAKNKTKQFMDDPDNHKSFTLRQIKYGTLYVKIDHEEGINDSHSQAHFDGLCLGLDMLIDELERRYGNDQ